MKAKLLIAVATLALAVSPALAQKEKMKKSPPRLFAGQGIVKGNAVYDCTGQYLGSDPDAKVRLQLLKEGADVCK
jgi:hypothetical protein